MAAKALPAQDVLNQLLSYDPETGNLRWKERGPEWFNATPARTAQHTAKIWNLRYAGTPALHAVSVQGYREGHLLGAHVKAHRVIWMMMTGSEPDQVDHINGDRVDNRWLNCREVTAAENTRNQKRRRDNTTGLVGVSWYHHERKHGKWLAKIGNRSLGYFDCFARAVATRRAAEIEHGFHENHGRAA